MATQTLNTTHEGLERVLRAAEALATFAKAAWAQSRRTAREQQEWAKLEALARTDSRLLADLRAAKLRADGGQ